jgi:flavin-dependent dehydrogenase
MASKRAVVVGAGLAGLCAAVSARRMGYEVTCLNMFSREGGVPQSYPTVDASPFDPGLMSRWLGLPVDRPYVGPADQMRAYVFGKRFDIDPSAMRLHCIERGTRSTAIDHYLYEKAVEMGVEFEFDHPVLSKKELAELPPNTIIATGPYTAMFQLLDIPYEMAYGYVCRGVFKENGERSDKRICIAYFDSYTKDYAYIASANGVFFGLLFSRSPIGERQMDVWESQLAEQEGLSFSFKDLQQGPFRSRYPSSPRLFAGDKILAGTISGTQDPGTYFGAHGAMVSGKIAAVALEDKAAAWEMFRYANRSYNLMWLGRRVAINYSPDWARRPLLERAMAAQSNPALVKLGGQAFQAMIPGYLLLKKRMDRYSKWL